MASLPSSDQRENIPAVKAEQTPDQLPAAPHHPSPDSPQPPSPEQPPDADAPQAASPDASPASSLPQDLERHLSALTRQLTSRLDSAAREEAQRQQALAQRENALRRRELSALARESLEKRGLPGELAKDLPFQDEKGLEAALDLLENAFRAAVQQGVEERLLTKAPRASSLRPLSELSDAEYYAALGCHN